MRKPYYIKATVSQFDNSAVEQIRFSQISNINTSEVAYYIIDMHNTTEGWDILCRIRRNLAPSVYLKPVIFLLDNPAEMEDIIPSADGAIVRNKCDYNVLEEWVSRLEQVNQWIDELPDSTTAKDTNIAFKMLRMIASRNRELQPLTTIKRLSGYVYPLLDPLFGKHDSGVLQGLEFLQSQHIISPRFISRSHFCVHCGSAFLNFKETCPHCSVEDIRADELIHHFKCAHIGDLSEFKDGGRLVCPKCERELRHIGVDYDKPSIVYHCNSCNHRFQDPKIMTSCYNCGRQSEPENQKSREINAYTVTSIGQNAAIHGLDTLFTTILDQELNLFSEKAFRDFFYVEMSRINRYKISTSSLVIIHFQDLDQLYIELGSRAREVFKELSIIFKAILRQSDVITARNETLFYIIMTETPPKGAKRAVQRLEQDIHALFENNLDFVPKMSIKIEEFSENLNLNMTLESFLKNDY